MASIEKEQIKKNCDNCRYGFQTLVCRKPTAELCGNFSKWEPIPGSSNTESEDKNE